MHKSIAPRFCFMQNRGYYLHIRCVKNAFSCLLFVMSALEELVDGKHVLMSIVDFMKKVVI